jgi:glycosyltransferase involved in cell wall biosynthesis
VDARCGIGGRNVTSGSGHDREPSSDGARGRQLTVGLLAGGDCFEDFYDKIGVSIEDFRTRLSGGWLLNYVDALRSVDVRTVLVFVSSRVHGPRRFVHGATGAPVWILPAPRLHRALLKARDRWSRSPALASLASYAATPIRALFRALDRERCDAILCQEYESTRFDLSVLTRRLHGRPVYATYQGANETAGLLERVIRRRTVRRCNGLIIASRSERERVSTTYGMALERIAPIPNAVDVVGWRPIDRDAARGRLGIADDAGVVEWHGHAQVWRKGLDVLLDAWGLVCAERPDRDLLLLLVGQGRNTGELRRRVEGDRRVRWIDRYVHDRDELKMYVCAADVYTLPSRHEGFAIAPLEAMACGLPVVGADASGVADLLGDGEEAGGVVVPREDPVALATALRRLLEDPALARQLGSQARRRAQEEFSLAVVGRRLRDFVFPTASRDLS